MKDTALCSIEAEQGILGAILIKPSRVLLPM